jgi:hypothetical protein
MVDYGPGDEIVCVTRHHGLNDIGIVTAGIYVCDRIIKNEYHLECNTCGDNEHEVLLVGIPRNYKWALCLCDFRKKLDFKKLCNVDETTKIKEDA